MGISGFIGDTVVSRDFFLETVLWEDVLLRTDMWCFSGDCLENKGIWWYFQTGYFIYLHFKYCPTSRSSSTNPLLSPVPFVSKRVLPHPPTYSCLTVLASFYTRASILHRTNDLHSLWCEMRQSLVGVLVPGSFGDPVSWYCFNRMDAWENTWF